MSDGRNDKTENYGVSQNAYLFNTQYKDEDKVVEIRVNPEFTQSEALIKAKIWAEAFGRLPFDLRKSLNYVNIHNGDYVWNAAKNGVQIHL